MSDAEFQGLEDGYIFGGYDSEDCKPEVVEGTLNCTTLGRNSIIGRQYARKIAPAKPQTPTKCDNHVTPSVRQPPPLDALFSMKVVKTQAITPMPNFDSMQDEELNVCFFSAHFFSHTFAFSLFQTLLARCGTRPFARRKAIALLKQFHNTIHPLIPANQTPSRKNVFDAIQATKSDAPKTKKRRKRSPKKATADENAAYLPEAPQTSAAQSEADAKHESTEDLGLIAVAIPSVLRFLRLPQNADLYNEILCLKPVQHVS